jgi:hypothetical protein
MERKPPLRDALEVWTLGMVLLDILKVNEVSEKVHNNIFANTFRGKKKQ